MLNFIKYVCEDLGKWKISKFQLYRFNGNYTIAITIGLSEQVIVEKYRGSSKLTFSFQNLVRIVNHNIFMYRFTI